MIYLKKIPLKIKNPLMFIINFTALKDQLLVEQDMHLKKITVIHFKNYKQGEVELSPKINCFLGNNGVGKTNLLDAIYYLSFCKSYFNPIDSQNINHEEDFFMIQGEYERKGKTENIACSIKKNTRKQCKRNQKEYPKLSDHIGLIPLVISSPQDSVLIKGGSEERRKFIDSVISQYDREYLETLIQYNKIISQRNKLLKELVERRNNDVSMIEIYNGQLIPKAELIHSRRVEFIRRLVPVFQDYYNRVSREKENISLHYESGLNNQNYAALLRNSLEKDKILQYTTTGVHKDDLTFNIEGHPLKKSGSQGQQKTFTVALKLAQFDFMKEINNFKPILLLDDIFDKLDAHRVKEIVNLVAENHFGQIFITDTNKHRVENILEGIGIDHQIFMIQDGEIKNENHAQEQH